MTVTAFMSSTQRSPDYFVFKNLIGNMRFWLTFILFCSILSTTMGAVALEVQKTTNGTCKSSEGKYYTLGESWPVERCMQATCTKNEFSGQIVVQYLSCGALAVSDGCQILYDNTTLYPECCKPNIVCT